MRLKLKHPELLRSYRKVLTLYENENWNIIGTDELGLLLSMDIPKEIVEQSDFINLSVYWDNNKDNIISDLLLLNRYKKIKKVQGKIKK